MRLFGPTGRRTPPKARPRPYDPALIQGARNAIEVCLGVRKDQAVYILTDQASESVGSALYDAARRCGKSVNFQVLEHHVDRPAKELPETIMSCLDKCQVCLYAVFPQPGELLSRIQFVKKVESLGIKYAHMVGITEAIMCQGMRADFRKVDEVSRRLMKFARKARTIRVKSRCGTDLKATFNPKYIWRKTSGIIEEVWSNLPGGEIFTFPESVDGVFVVDGTIGDHFSSKYGVLSETPMRLDISRSMLQKVTCANAELEKEFWDYCHESPGSDRVGEFAIGTNLAIFEFVGNLLQDEKMPGVHIAFGDPYGSQTGADWSCTTHVDVITASCDVWIDDTQVMEAGIFLADKLGFDYSYLAEDPSVAYIPFGPTMWG